MTKDLTVRIDEIIAQRSLLKHPFYQAWTMGELPVESLRHYAAQYYHFELAYPTFLSGLHHRCAHPAIRRQLLDNLWDEEQGSENHVELWLRFCDALGVDRDEVRGGSPEHATAGLVSTYKHLTSGGPLAAGAAALYAYESQVPALARVKMEGLRKNYGLEDDRAVSFFAVHRTLDEAHSEAEREMVTALADGEEDAVLDAVNTATGGLWRFLDGVYDSPQ